MRVDAMLTFDNARTQLLRILRTGSIGGTSLGGPTTRIPLPWEDFPVPGLVFIALKTLLGLKNYGPGEKMAWGIEAAYGDTAFAIQLEKFGLQLYVPQATDTCAFEDIKRALQKCCAVAESYLMPEVSDRLLAARVTLRNQYHRFEDAYQFFRKASREAYAAPPPEPVVRETPRGTVTSSNPFLPRQEGGYLASAMLDAYFSKLEHVLVLLAAFSTLDVENGALQKLVGDRWDEKFKALFNVQTDQIAKRVYDDLKKIKEDLRNPASHGGFLKKGASFLFHSEAGALPVLLTRVNRDFEFHITPVPPVTFEQVCEVLDEADSFLRDSPLAEGFAYVAAGLDVPFDAESRQRYLQAIASGEFEDLIERQAYLQDMHANMDY
jgi:hypothetical protein